MITGEWAIWETEEDKEAKKDGREANLIMAEPDMEEVVWVSKVHGETRAVDMAEVTKIGILQQDMAEAVHHQDGGNLSRTSNSNSDRYSSGIERGGNMSGSGRGMSSSGGRRMSGSSSGRGFASMDPDTRSKIAAKGGRASHSGSGSSGRSGGSNGRTGNSSGKSSSSGNRGSSSSRRSSR
jgi:hypothetical protein